MLCTSFKKIRSKIFISTYINTKNVCPCVSVCVHFFLNDFETDWHKVAFWPWKGSKTILLKKYFIAELFAFFIYFFKISL